MEVHCKNRIGHASPWPSKHHVAGAVFRFKSTVVRLSLLRYWWQWHVAQQYTHYALSRFHYNNGYANWVHFHETYTNLSIFFKQLLHEFH